MSLTTIRDGLKDDSVLRSPYDFYEALRRDAPVFFSPTIDAYIVSRHADVRRILSSPELFSSTPRGKTNAQARFAYADMYRAAGTPAPVPGVVTSDGHTHSRYRALVDEWFSGAAVQELDGRIQTLVAELVDSFIDAGRVDIFTALCMKLPLFIIMDMLGLPRDDAAIAERTGEAAVRLAAGGMETEERRQDYVRDLIDFQIYLQPYIEESRRNPSQFLLSHLANAQTIDGDKLSDAEIHTLVQTLNAGGTETTTNGLGNMFGMVAVHREMQDQLRVDPGLIPRFIEEVARLESPVTGVPRWAVEQTEIAGVQIPAGAALHLRVGAANRDEERYGCPAELDITRKGLRNHLGFGLGVHYCLGATLARTEMRIALEEVLRRTSRIELDPDAAEPLHTEKLLVRGWLSLPVRFAKAV